MAWMLKFSIAHVVQKEQSELWDAICVRELKMNNPARRGVVGGRVGDWGMCYRAISSDGDAMR